MRGFGEQMLQRVRENTTTDRVRSGTTKIGRRRRTAIEYVAQKQVGYLLRTAFQRHTAIFTSRMVGSLTQTQFAALVVLYFERPLPHNELGELICLDAATVKGVLDRLKDRGLVKAWTTPTDRRSRTVTITPKGSNLIEKALPHAQEITRETLEPLSPSEQALLISFLERLIPAP
jgi:MarR family transcriptional regulator, lower aerobic nicotinate degradation pathway regulator